MDKILCYSCNKTKNKLSVKKSTLLPVNMFVCEGCIAEKYEPRWIVILAGRQYGIDAVRDVIVKKKYLGDTISAEELMI